MIGIELSEFINFIRQLGLALAGAGALWAVVFCILGRRRTGAGEVIFQWIAHRLTYLFLFGFFVAGIGWWLSDATQAVLAHEGVILIPSYAEVLAAATFMAPLYLFWIMFTAFGFLIKIMRSPLFDRMFLPYFVTQFMIVFILVSFPAWTGQFDRAQLFYMGHSFHSIFTLGTVLTLDFLFLSTKASEVLKQHVYPLFPKISKVIWVGLGLDFLSVALVFHDAIELTHRFFFMQTVVAIIIINGMILSGYVTRVMLAMVREGGRAPSEKESRVADICGTISITSWSTITFVDFFHNLTLEYHQFLAVYVLVMVILYIGHTIWQHFDRKALEFSQSVRV